jgi:DNA repair protein RadA/Sms
VPKWAGQCPSCNAWNSIVEELAAPTAGVTAVETPSMPARPIGDIDAAAFETVSTRVSEVDRVLGGGLVPGSVTLIGGEPGIGKSTLLMQVLAGLAGDRDVLYLTAEESAQQVRQRAERLGSLRRRLFLAAETSLPKLLGHINAVSPAVVVVDSIQSIADPELGSAAGSVAQVRHCAQRLVTLAKEQNIAVVLVGHVTKDGGLAGPRVLEHLVDTVLSFEGERDHSLRVLRAVKHRFGSTQELGILAMGEGGLLTVDDPSQVFLADRQPGVSGSVVVPTVEGRRPLLVEIQALVAETKAPLPRRQHHGVDAGRVPMMAAVLQRRCGLPLSGADLYVMAVGGARVHEPAADLAIALAIASSGSGEPFPADAVAVGEVGLGGEVRSVNSMERRLMEAARLGFTRAIVPRSTAAVAIDLELIRVATISEALGELGV